MVRRVSKNPKAIRKPSKHDLPYETIHRIAHLLLVDKLPHTLVAKEIGISPSRVLAIREAKSQVDMWIDAIADLGRKGLIE